MQIVRTWLISILVWPASLYATSPMAEPAAATAPADAAGSAVAAARADEIEEEAATPPVGTVPMSKAEEKYWTAMKLFRGRQAADLAAGRAALEEAAAGEFTHAQLFLGECYQSGSYGFARNPKKGAAFFRLAAERGNAFAQVSHGLGLFSGVGVRRDERKAAEWLTAALAPDADYTRPKPPADFFERGAGEQDETVAGTAEIDPMATAQAQAHFVLGVMANARKDLPDAQAHYVAAAMGGADGRAGLQPAAIQAAINYAFGHGVPRDKAKAAAMLEQARKVAKRTGISLVHNYAAAKLVDDFAVSELEEAVAKSSDELEGELQMGIARQFTDRKSKDYNPREAAQWFELAAESGKSWAMLELAFLHGRGDLGPPDAAKAFAWFERAGGGDKPKHFLGTANLVIALYHGLGVPADRVRALEIARKHREDVFVCHLAEIGQCPPTVLTFEQELALVRTWAKEKKDPTARYVLALRHLYGAGVKRNLKDAVGWLEKAAKDRHGPACRMLGYIYEVDGGVLGLKDSERWVKATELYQRGADAGDAIAMTNLGHFYASGRAGRTDEARAEELYNASLAIDPDYLRTVTNLGALYEDRFRKAQKLKQEDDTAKYRDRMLTLYRKADEGGEGYAANNLGRLEYEGILGPADFQKAYGYFEKAAERGHREARFRLGKMHESGEGVPVTPVEAAYHYRLAGLDGHLEALHRLVDFYMHGKGGAQDFERAQFWLMRLVDQGEIQAMTTLADVAMRQQRYEDAVRMFNFVKSRFGGDPAGIAYERLSICYRDGLGVKVKPARAKQYFEKALALGNPEAMSRSAKTLLAQGQVTAGIELLRKAAERSAAASYDLGLLYLLGQTVPADREAGLQRVRKAAQGNHAEALYFLAELTLKEEAGAPALDEAIRFALAAEALEQPKAAALREKLEQRRQASGAAAEQTTVARPT